MSNKPPHQNHSDAEKAKRISRNIIITTIITLINGLISTGFFVTFSDQLKRLKNFLIDDILLNPEVERVMTIPVRLSIVAIVAGISFGLFTLRKKQKYWYGILETGFAAANAYIFTGKFVDFNQLASIDNAALFVTGFTSIYLLVRGFTNISEGLNEPYAYKEVVSRLTKKIYNLFFYD